MIQAILPEGIVRLFRYAERFQRLGLSRRNAFSRKYRQALEISKIEILPRSVMHSDCVVDVGANVGDWSISIALLADIKKIIAFEPVSMVFDQLQRNTKGVSQIHCVRAALGSRVGEVTINVEALSALSSILPLLVEGRGYHDVKDNSGHLERVPLLTLDEALRDVSQINLLKIDVQGYEAEVLTGAHQVLQRTDVLLIEVMYKPYYDGALDFADLYTMITSVAPFKIWAISEPHFAQNGLPIWADAVFVRKDVDCSMPSQNL